MDIDPKFILHFVCIDFWNRPIFERANSGNYYGSINNLVSTEEELKNITESDLTYFGKDIEDDPMGTPIDSRFIIDRDSLSFSVGA